MEEDNIGAKFVATYYRLIFRSKDLLRKLYDTHANITRDSRVFQAFHLDFIPGLDLNPFSEPSFIVKILQYTSYNSGENLIVSVYGAWTTTTTQNLPDRFFTQQFILKKTNEKYMIQNDIFFNFNSVQQQPQNIYAANHDAMRTPQPAVQMPMQPQTIPVQQPQTIQQPTFSPAMPPPTDHAPPPPQPVAAPAPMQNKPRYHGQLSSGPRQRVDNFDPERTITILRLADSYKGKDVANAYSKFGTITNKNFTHNTVYIEYSTPGEAEYAASSRVPASIPLTQNVRVELGIKSRY